MSALEALEFRPEGQARPDTPAADTRPAPGWAETIGAGFRTTFDRAPNVQAYRLDEAYRPVIEALVERGAGKKSDYLLPWYKRLALPFTDQEMLDRDKIWREVRRQQAQDPEAFADLGDRESFDKAQLTRDGQREKDLETSARGGMVGTIIGGIPASFADPINLASLPIGGFGRTAGMKILTEGLVNAGVEVAEIPLSKRFADRVGEQYTPKDALFDVGLGFAFGAAVRGTIEGGVKVHDTLLPDRAIANKFREAFPSELRTPDQQAAVNIILRESAIDEASPYQRTYSADQAHRAKLAEVMQELEAGGVPRAPRPSASSSAGAPRVFRPGASSSAPIGGSAVLRGLVERGLPEHVARGVAAGVEAESRSNPNISNPTSGAQGIGQWLGTRQRELRRRYGDNPTLDQQLDFLVWELKGGDHGGKSVLSGADETDVLRRYITDFMRPAAGRETTGDLDRGMAALGREGQELPWGSSAGNGKPAPFELDDELEVFNVQSAALDAEQAALEPPKIRQDVLEAKDPVLSAAGRSVPIATFAADDIGVDAELMQFKSSGDQFGVTDRLQGVEQWDPIAAGTVTVWEGADGRRLIADGHQRLSLAKRIQAGGGGPVELNAFVLREADGFTAADARIVTALKNIGEGTGTAADAAKVLRDAGGEYAEAIAKKLPPRSALVRDGKALARLSDEAFGAIVNEVIPENYGAAIGHLAPDPATHMALVDVLHRADPPNRRQAEAIVRQALDAGFTRETQDGLFGAQDLVRELFAERAKVLDKGLAELKRLKGAFQVAARNADTLDAAGNKIDVGASEAAAQGNAAALALVERLALRKGNAVNELIDQAARRIADGEPLARVVRDFVAAVRELDLKALEREGGQPGAAGDGAGGSGRTEQPLGEDPQGPGELTPAERDQADQLGLLGDPAPDPKASQLFDDDAGEGVKATAESDWHDIEVELRDSFAARDAKGNVIGSFADEAAAMKAAGKGGTVTRNADAVALVDPAEAIAASEYRGKNAAGQDLYFNENPALSYFAIEQTPQGPRIIHPGDQLPVGADDAGAKLEQWIAEDPARARAAYEAIDGELSGSSEGGRIINTDLARELSPEYRADRSRSADVHEASSAFVKQLYAEKLAEDPPAGLAKRVLFTAGGTGAGKSTGLKAIGGTDAGIIYDTNMNSLGSAIKKIDQALEAGWPVRILYTYRDPLEALVNGALPRAERMGRTVPLQVHMDTHIGARKVIDELADHYAGDDRVVLQAIDNSRGKGKAAPIELEKLPEINQVGLYERAETEIRAAYDRGAIGRETLRGTLGEREGDLRPAEPQGSGGRGAGDSGQPEQAGSRGPLDRGAETDPNIAERQRAAAQAGAAGPMRASAEQDGTMGLGLFDQADQPKFDLEDGKGERTAGEIQAELEADRAGLEAIRSCLK